MPEGTCLCGAAKVIVTGEPIAHLVCHCVDCRRWTGSVNYGVLVKHEQVTIEGEYNTFNLRKAQGKDGGWDRKSCAKCNGGLTATSADGAVDDVCASIVCGTGEKQVPFAPKFHANYPSRIKDVKDGLPKYKDFPTDIGGSGETVDE